MNLEAQGSYGPAGYIEAGRYFSKKDLALLEESLEALQEALDWLEVKWPEAWLVIFTCYLSDPADHSAIVERWRKKGSVGDVRVWQEEGKELRRKIGRGELERKEAREKLEEWKGRYPGPIDWHDFAVGKLAYYLRNTDLYVVYPKRMSAEEERKGELQNAEIYAVYCRHKKAGLAHKEAVEQTREDFLGISADKVEMCIEFRDAAKLTICKEENCKNEVESQNLCRKHYQQQYRRQKGKKKKRAS